MFASSGQIEQRGPELYTLHFHLRIWEVSFTINKGADAAAAAAAAVLYAPVCRMQISLITIGRVISQPSRGRNSGGAPGLIATDSRTPSFPFNLNDIFYELLVKQLGTPDLSGLVRDAFEIVMNFLQLLRAVLYYLTCKW